MTNFSIKQMEVRVSIIIPVYNVSPFLDKCLSSCINQSFKDIEIIVVNDGSTDTSSRIIEKYATEDKCIIVVEKENQGLIFARKSGLDIARGEYVFHLDGDDFIENDTIEILFQKAIDEESDYVVGRFYEVSDGVKKGRYCHPGFDGLSGQDLAAYILECRWNICGRLIKRTLFDDIIYKPVFMGEDLFLNMQICLKVKKATWVDAYVYAYVKHPSSVTARNANTTIKLKLEMIEAIFYLLTIHTYDQRIIERVYLLFFPFIFSCMEERKSEINDLLRSYYWDNEEVRTFLWRKKKFRYLIVGGFLHYPTLTSFVVKIGRKIDRTLRKIKLNR